MTKTFFFSSFIHKGQIHVDNKLKDIKSLLDQGKEVDGGLLTILLKSKELTVEEIYANMTEMLLAGVDTVSFLLLLLVVVATLLVLLLLFFNQWNFPYLLCFLNTFIYI